MKSHQGHDLVLGEAPAVVFPVPQVARRAVAHPQRGAVLQGDVEVYEPSSPTRWAQVRRIHASVVGSWSLK